MYHSSGTNLLVRRRRASDEASAWLICLAQVLNEIMQVSRTRPASITCTDLRCQVMI